MINWFEDSITLGRNSLNDDLEESYKIKYVHKPREQRSIATATGDPLQRSRSLDSTATQAVMGCTVKEPIQSTQANAQKPTHLTTQTKFLERRRCSEQPQNPYANSQPKKRTSVPFFDANRNNRLLEINAGLAFHPRQKHRRSHSEASVALAPKPLRSGDQDHKLKSLVSLDEAKDMQVYNNSVAIKRQQSMAEHKKVNLEMDKFLHQKYNIHQRMAGNRESLSRKMLQCIKSSQKSAESHLQNYANSFRFRMMQTGSEKDKERITQLSHQFELPASAKGLAMWALIFHIWEQPAIESS
jgi:hypothetical protein